MTNDTILPFSFPAVGRKKITAAFDGGRLTSDGGVMLLSLADRRVGVAEKLSCVFPERRDPTRIAHTLCARQIVFNGRNRTRDRTPLARANALQPFDVCSHLAAW